MENKNIRSAIQIITIDASSSLLKEVIRLADENSATLGFLPREAFVKHAAEQRIFVAVDESNDVLGYLLYGTNQRESLAYITHLCINQTYRMQGISKALFDKLVEVTKQKYRGIRVRCRREYEASHVWPKLGFHVRGEVPGRSKHGSTLTVWWFDFGYPTLFSYVFEQMTQSKLAIVVDANIFFDLINPINGDNRLSHALLADWLDIEICITNEIRIEINRNDDPIKRRQGMESVNSFSEVTSPNEITQRTIIELRPLFSIDMSESDESDLRQISKTIAANVPFFITNDSELLKKAEQVYEKFGLRIITPSDMVIHQDALIRETEYQPARLAGSQIQRKRVPLQQISHLEKIFRNNKQEKKSEFIQKLHSFLIDPYTYEVDLVESGEKPLALIVYSRQTLDTLGVPLLRVVDDPIASTLAIHLINDSVIRSVQESRIFTKFSDGYSSAATLKALSENEFVLIDGYWVKANLQVIERGNSLAARLEDLGKNFPHVGEYFQKLSNTFQASLEGNNLQSLLQIERSLWPLKIIDLDIPTYIVPIRPQWAMNLFDPNIANQTLFGADPFLMLNVENVYYRSSRTPLAAPARILWYVSQGKGNFHGTMCIRATSYLDEVIINTSKALYSSFKRLGVYTWEDVVSVAKGNVEQAIMAFRFSKTELFKKPIHRNVLEAIWAETRRKHFNVQGPVRVSNDLFIRLYRLGFKK